MSASQDHAYLLISSPTDQGNTTRVELTAAVTCLGRPEPQDAGPNYIELKLESISRRHGRITRQGNAYVLENWQGRGKIGLYERSLAPGESHTLRHSDIFRLPDVEGPHVRIIFLIGDQTRFLPLEVEHQRPRVRIFGEDVDFTPLEYRLVAYLHQHAGTLCRHDDIIAHLWPDTVGRKEQLEVLLSGVRKKIRAASGGFTFMQVFRGEGICLVV